MFPTLSTCRECRPLQVFSSSSCQLSIRSHCEVTFGCAGHRRPTAPSPHRSRRSTRRSRHRRRRPAHRTAPVPAKESVGVGQRSRTAGRGAQVRRRQHPCCLHERRTPGGCYGVENAHCKAIDCVRAGFCGLACCPAPDPIVANTHRVPSVNFTRHAWPSPYQPDEVL